MNLAEPIRDLLVANSTIASMLPTYLGGRPIFTRRPVPADAPYPMLVVSPDVSSSDQDGINFELQSLVRDIAVYGQNDTPAKYRAVEDLAYTVRDLYHRQQSSLVVPGWSVVDVTTIGPIPAPTDDDQTIGRVVSLTVRLARM